jgi:NTP pyrophosphatase (non-canonical NTP hydrolase)
MITEKNEIQARIEELNMLASSNYPLDGDVKYYIELRKKALTDQLASAPDPIMSSVIRSHKAICKAKSMGEKDAYGQDPTMYYTLGICGEAGELANDVVKALRNGWDKDRLLEAVKGELPDVVIYSYILAYVLDINLSKLVSEKIDVVVKRAESGYYGGKID